jgi:drug/metabolite transporter (DMT)-like permease
MKLKLENKTTRSFVLGLISAFLFGAATPASKALMGDLQPQMLAGLLYFGAGLGVLPMVLNEKAHYWPWRAGRSTILLLLGAISLGGIIGPLLVLIGLETATAGDTSLWLNLEFVATVMLGHFVFREHLSSRGWIAACGTLIASVLLVKIETGGEMIPFILIASGCLCWGVDNHLTALIDGISPAQSTLWKGISAGSFNMIMAGVLSGTSNLSGTVLIALLVGVFSYGISITLYIFTAQELGATRSQMIFSVAPFFGLFLSVSFLGESFTLIQAIATAIIVVSLIILFSEKHSHKHGHTYFSHGHQHTHDVNHHNHCHDDIKDDLSHTHWHDHHAQNHEHEHWPDLHHRHNHKRDNNQQ